MSHCSRILLLMSFSGARRCHGRTFEQDYFLRTGFLLASKRRSDSVGDLELLSTLISGEHQRCNLHWRTDRHGFAFSDSSCNARANVVFFFFFGADGLDVFLSIIQRLGYRCKRDRLRLVRNHHANGSVVHTTTGRT